MNNIILFSTNCPKCKVIELKLKQKNLNFEVITDVDKVVAIGKDHGIESAPILEVDKKFYDFAGAVQYLKEVK